MNFDYNEEQQLLADSIKRFIDKDYDFETRKYVASAEGYSAEVWGTLAEMGLLGLPFSPDYEGFGGGAVDLMSVMECMGAGLVVEPYLPTVTAAQFVARAGSEAQKKAILPAVASGELKDGLRADRSRGALRPRARRGRGEESGAGWTLDGVKQVVIGAPQADQLVVSARTSNDGDRGISLFLVDARAAGVSMKAYRTIDELRAADVGFKGVQLGADALIGKPGEGLAHIEAVVDFATALLCAEAVGAIKYANDATLEYIKTRKQFGVPIGAFQALQHRMVDMVISWEQARSMACMACARVDSEKDAGERKRLISAAKIRIADACRHVSQEAIQLHGGMGMTEEMKVSHTFRRLTMIAQQFGDADHHLERFAALDKVA
ncbi:MAG: acyl-CoA dehydrogenase family protein [Betaproteobacteria bacterium]|nr:acyl-CoA dehydrogenase family protein [Betaproteobacteria bacterium]